MLKTLKRLFVPDEDTRPAPQARPRGPATIILPRSVLARRVEDPDAVVEAVRVFVRAMQGRGLYRPDEMPPQATQVFHIAAYASAVMAGGHRQFLDLRPKDDAVLDSIRDGLRAMEAEGFQAIFNGLRTWIDLHPDANGQSREATDGQASALVELDALFLEMDGARPLVDTMARWIEGLPNLQVADDETIDHLFTHMARLNPRRGARRAARTLGLLQDMLDDPQTLGLGMAGLALSPPRPVLGIDGVTPGERVPSGPVLVRTSRQPLVVVPEEARLVVFEQADGADGPVQGSEIAALSRDRVEETRALAARLAAAAGVALLLGRADVGGAPGFVSAVPVDAGEDRAPSLRLWVVSDGTLFDVLATPDLMTLSDGLSGARLAEASRAEIDAYAAQLAAVD